jgi:hypothetical protein
LTIWIQKYVLSTCTFGCSEHSWQNHFRVSCLIECISIEETKNELKTSTYHVTLTS